MTEILAVGLNSFGQLGIGSRVRKETYVPTKFGIASTAEEGARVGSDGVVRSTLNADDIVDVQCGCHCTVVLYKDGVVEIAGNVTNDVMPLLTPVQISFPPKAVQVACGRKHVLLLFDSGCVLSWGTGYFGQLGHGDDSSLDQPTLIKALTPPALGQRAVLVAAGGHHSGIVTDSGNAFMWGLNRSSQCGTSIKSDVLLTPKHVDMKKAVQQNNNQKVHIEQLVCGRNHSAFVSREGEVYAWGATSFGRTGLNVSIKIQTNPFKLPIFDTHPVQQLSSGDFHMLALCRNGSVYSWGYSSDGQTGHLTLLHCKTPRRLEYFDTISAEIKSVQCGSCYSVATDSEGYLWSWGYGDGGWMGLKPPLEEEMSIFESDDALDYPILTGHTHIRSFDSTHTCIVPQKVTLLKNKMVQSVRAGGAHTIIFATPRPASVFSSIDEAELKEGGDILTSMLLHSSSDEESEGGNYKAEAKAKAVVDSKTGKK